MNLPSQGQVLAITRNVASAAAGGIAVFGLQSKIDPAQVTALINSLGTLVNDAILVIGIATPIVASYLAQRSASIEHQKQAIMTAQPNTIIAEASSPAGAKAAASAASSVGDVNKVIAAPAIAIAAGPVGDGAKVVSK